jgi:hypothetical protein
MLLGKKDGATYLAELGLPHLCIDADGHTTGSIVLTA